MGRGSPPRKKSVGAISLPLVCIFGVKNFNKFRKVYRRNRSLNVNVHFWLNGTVVGIRDGRTGTYAQKMFT